ncbi:MAG: hypothetical protein IJY61_07185 [Candidatus Gastranaerophilales bacterium]|nr:hypothetical protein [Candidatus Gastranaerophilales bacterium]
MKRLCIFAHYDKNNLIDDYIIYYLRELKKSFNKIIFVSDSDLSKKETDKIIDLVDYIQAFNHGEYDWGSYKYGYFIAKENYLLQGIDEVLFCNDSVYGPVFQLEPIFEKMSNDNDCDFWGMYENQDGIIKGDKANHLQSWFLLLKRNVVDSDLFDDFICSVKHLEDKNDIIQKYEINFTQRMSCCFKYKALYTSENGNAVTQATPILLEKGFPFIKTVVTRKYNMPFQLVPKELVRLIMKHAKRIGRVPIIPRFFKTLAWKSKMKKFT